MPPYQDIARSLARRIASGEYPVGSHLPVRHVIAAEYGVTVGTIGRAMRMLDMDGLIDTAAGSRAGPLVRRTQGITPDLADLAARVVRLEQQVFGG